MRKMNSIIINKCTFNITKGISLLLLSIIIFMNNRIGYSYFVYLIGGSSILSGFIHLSAGMESQKNTIENIYLVILGLFTTLGSIVMMIYLYHSYPYYSNKVMFSFWLLIQIIYTISYLILLSKRDKKQFTFLILFLIGLIILTTTAFLNNKSSFGINFTILPFAYVGILNFYVFYVFRKYKQLTDIN